MQRRRWLQLGLASAALLAVAGSSAWLTPAGLDGHRLTAAGRTVLQAITRAMLDGRLPAAPGALDAELQAQVARVEALVAGMPQATRSELSRLLGVLAGLPGRSLLAGLSVEWPAASVLQVQQALESMRHSRLSLRQQAYHALRELSQLGHYTEPSHWAAIGYPGPTDL